MQAAGENNRKITTMNTRQGTAIYRARATYHPQTIIISLEKQLFS
jgi:hypothetical protein